MSPLDSHSIDMDMSVSTVPMHKNRNEWYLRLLVLILALTLFVLSTFICINYIYQPVVYTVMSVKDFGSVISSNHGDDVEYTLSDDGSVSRPIPLVKPEWTVSSQKVDGRHHTVFQKVCLQKDNTDRKQVLFLNVDNATRFQYDTEYWNLNNIHWRLYHSYVESREWPLRGAHYFPGSTFLYTLAVDNVAQFYQELVCHTPALIDTEYRRNHSIVGYDRFFSIHMHIQDAHHLNTTRDWCESQLRLTADSSQALQSSRMELVDHQDWKNLGSPEYMCFDELTVYQPRSCGWTEPTSPYPISMKQSFRTHLDRVFDDLQLRKHISCVQNITIYNRMNTHRRRLLNADQLSHYLLAQARLHGLDIRVKIIEDIRGNLFDQLRSINSEEMRIEPHSASNYDAPGLPFNGVFAELGVHGSWYGRGLANQMPQTYRVYMDGMDLVEYDKEVDDQPYEGERSFRVSESLMERLFNLTMYESSVSFCRLNRT